MPSLTNSPTVASTIPMEPGQRELFKEFPSAVKPSSHLASFKVGKKIIEVAGSVWKDGRIRADLSEYGAGCPVSRKQDTIVEIIARALRAFFGQAVEAVSEAVSEELEQAHRQRRPSNPRVNNKRCQTEEAGWPKRYINPFEMGVWNFSKAPHWLLVRREPSLGEKLVYARLTYAPREAEGEKICDRKDVSLGVIFGLNQGMLAKELGMRRESVLLALKALRKRGLIDYNGNQGARACIRFFWHPWMPTCAFNAQVGDSTCAENAQVLVRKTHNSCAENTQVTLGTEKRETAREVAAALTLNDWLKTVVQAKYPDWQLADLQSQWRLHGAKADRKKQWAKGDREHFLKAWMPRAANPRAGKPAEKVVSSEEPKWWADFVDECYPNAPKSTYGQIAARLPDVIAEGHRWAASRGSV